MPGFGPLSSIAKPLSLGKTKGLASLQAAKPAKGPVAPKLKMSVPGISVSNKYLRAGLQGKSVAPSRLTDNFNWHVSGLKNTGFGLQTTGGLLSKTAMDLETKKEVANTAAIGAVGVGTGILGERILSKPGVQAALQRLPSWGKAGLVMGGLGLAGDYAAVKANKAMNAHMDANQGTHMNKTAKQLLQKAASIRAGSAELVAVEMLKQAGMAEEDARYEVLQASMEKTAADQLTFKGVDAEEAVKMVKAANINVRDLANVGLVTEEEELASSLEKAASEIETLQAQLDAAHGQISEMEKAAEATATAAQVKASKPALPEQFTKMASVGAFTFEDLAALEAMPQSVMEKVASAMDTPWEFGKAAGAAKDQGDPLLNFLMS